MEISFHTGIDDRLAYACRLLRKALTRGSRVLVDGSAAEIDVLDQALWTFEAQEFLPHWRWRAGEEAKSAALRAPIWLIEEGQVLPKGGDPPRILVHLGDQAVVAPAAWERVIELVSNDDEIRRQARQRWRLYESQGFQVVHHPVVSSP